MTIRQIQKTEMQKVLSLIWVSFNRFVAPDYTREGVDTFYRLLHDQRALQDAVFFGAFEGNSILGVIAARNQNSHICFFFVDEQYQNRKVGASLFSYFLRETDQKVITVNASPYAVEIYHSLGFQDSAEVQMRDGIRFTPMTYVREQRK